MRDSEQESRSQRLLLWGALPLLVGLSALFKVRDLDVWWRVKTGEWIWMHRAIPSTDPFSHTAEGPWNCVEPAGNLFLYAFHAVFGPGGLAWAGSLMALGLGLLAVGLTLRVVGEGPRVGPICVAIGFFVGVSNYRFGPKPEMFSLCGLAALLWLLHTTEQRRSRKLVYWAPLVILAWGWLHRGSTLGIAVLAAAVLVWALRRETRALALPALGALVLALVALLLTPGMAHSLSSAANVVSTSAYVEHIGEWQPLSWQAVRSTMPLLLPLIALWLALAPVQRRLHFATLVVLGTGFMAFRHVRFVPLFALAMMPEVAWALTRVLRAHGDRIAERVRPAVLRSLLVAASLAAIAWPYLNRPVTTWGPGVHDYHRPAHAATFLATHPPPGRMFNTFNYGSYLLYANGPEQKVFIDGRNDQVYSSEFFRQAAVTPGNARVLAHLVQAYDLGYAVLQCTKMVNRSYLWLYRNPEWYLVYLDDKAAILVKRTADSQAYLDAHAYRELSPDTALARARSPEADPRHEAFSAEVLRHVAEVPHSIRAHHLAALVHQHAGREEAYLREREWVRALAAERRLDVALP